MTLDPTVVVAIISAAAVAITGAFTYAGVRFTQRQARAAAERTAELERRSVDASAFERARVTWESHVEDLDEQVRALRAEAEELRTQARTLRNRVDGLERGRDADRTRIRELTAYARDLLRILAEHEIEYPPPPEGLET